MSWDLCASCYCITIACASRVSHGANLIRQQPGRAAWCGHLVAYILLYSRCTVFHRPSSEGTLRENATVVLVRETERPKHSCVKSEYPTKSVCKHAWQSTEGPADHSVDQCINHNMCSGMCSLARMEYNSTQRARVYN